MLQEVRITATVLESEFSPGIAEYSNLGMFEISEVLVPVSSTVIPISIFKIGYGINVSGGGSKLSKPSQPTKLITVNKKTDSKKAHAS
ncbi:hypothetical protein J437_LFUL007739 [Ladona fulva]|uniref:Uncharacterized protein n=1 Tax=Ladona fulva TaxID=123851 RepID=A0A8K0KFB8_LADFU|nr:hypothetical protein J437_LFUL007739 [Ladona fulva]